MAAPVLAVSGALAAAPSAFAGAPQANLASAITATHPITAHLDAAVQPSRHAVRTYTVRTGDTLAAIAQHFYGHANDWHFLYRKNRWEIRDPNLIYTGQVLVVPRHHRHASASDMADVTPVSQTSGSTSSQSASTGATGSSANLSAAVQLDITDGNNLLAVGQYLVENGYSDAAAAGIASCIDGESRGNPESVGSGGGGLIGWTPLSSAAPNPDIVTGNPEQDMMTQLADILYYNSTEIGQAQVDRLNSQSDPVAAADFYSQNFERPAVTDSDVVPSVAEQIFSALGG